MAKRTNKLINPFQAYYSGQITWRKFIPGIAWFFILLILLCLPGKDLPPGNDWLNAIYFDKWVHIGLFGLLASLFMAPVFAAALPTGKKSIYIILIATVLSAWGLATEWIQDRLIAGRSFDLYDWMADTIGCVAAIFFTWYFFSATRDTNIADNAVN